MFIPPAYAQAAGDTVQPGSLAGIIQFLTPLAFIAIAFYFLMVRPQAKRQKEFLTKINAVKRNDTVVTAGGIVGKVTKVEDAFVEVEIAPNTRVRVVKATLTEVTNASAKPAND